MKDKTERLTPKMIKDFRVKKDAMKKTYVDDRELSRLILRTTYAIMNAGEDGYEITLRTYNEDLFREASDFIQALVASEDNDEKKPSE